MGCESRRVDGSGTMVHRADTDPKPPKTRVRIRPGNRIQAVAQPEEKPERTRFFAVGGSPYGRPIYSPSRQFSLIPPKIPILALGIIPLVVWD